MLMKKRIRGLGASVLLLLGVSALAWAQERTLPEDEFYTDAKQTLMSHYTGKTVRAKLPFPATRRGLEMLDGTVQTRAEKETPPAAANIGDELTIKGFKVNDNNIEVLLARTELPPKRRLPNPFSPFRHPRINLRFSRELNNKDLTIENINRLLDSALDVTPLLPPPPDTSAQASADPAAKAPAVPTTINPQSLPAAEFVRDQPELGPKVGELNIESTAAESRVYVDGSYSGLAPRTIRVRAGVHTILVVKAGFPDWEQRLYIPGAKLSRVRAELQH
jgi:hypothetical protein